MLSHDEIKTEPDREEAIRSLTVSGVKRERRGIFLACNLVRLEMERIPPCELEQSAPAAD